MSHATNNVGDSMYSGAPRPDALVRVGCAVIVENERGEVLLEKRSDCGLWGLPGGRVEPGESVIQSALREVLEETGLVVEVAGLVGVYSRCEAGRVVTYPDNGDVVQLVDIAIAAYRPKGNLTASHESECLAYFAPDALPFAEICPPAQQPLRDYVRGLRGQLD